jgi:type 1 glutamine amidotransferase
MNQGITEEQKGWLLEMLRAGKGLVVLHHALCSYSKWPEWNRLVGGKYIFEREEIDKKVWEPSTYQHGIDLTVKIADRRHPITRGLKEFAIHDEAYGGYWVSPKVHPLLKVSHPQSSEIIGWTSQYGKARVVVLQGGHDGKAYENESYRTLVQRAVLWAARRL